LEEESRPRTDRKRLQAREAELLAAHAKEWLGDLGRFFVGDWSGEDKPYHFAFARGWLDYLRTLPAPDAIYNAIARAPEVRLLRRLEIVYDMRYHPFDFDQFVEGPAKALVGNERRGEVYDGFSPLPPLVASPHLGNLRAFKIGFSDNGPELAHSTMVDPFDGCPAEQILALLAKCPRLVELYLNTDLGPVDALFASPQLEQLRVFQFYYGVGRYQGTNPYPLSTLAQNPAARNLRSLRFHPGRDATLALNEVTALLNSPHLPALEHLQLHMTIYGDEICEPLIASGLLNRLKTLDLGYGNMTDEGARLLAARPEVKKLASLDLSRNALTEVGISALRKAGVRVLITDNQHSSVDEYPEYLYSVDVE
ncbi:MAG: hypothetical protein K2V38_13030, partial [Gemmataceae bacterium]|nr:hypothetical protein [Gemmataceae bacterium]